MLEAWLSPLTAVLLLASPAYADRAGVESTMRFMERAVLAGDPDAYLKLVFDEDATLLKEQTNWAKDLKLHVPSEFSLSIREPEPKDAVGDAQTSDSSTAKKSVDPVFDDEAGLARIELLMKWTMPKLGRDGADLTRELSFPARFRLKNGQWLFAGEDWAEVHSGSGSPDQRDGASNAPNLCRFYPGFEEVAGLIVEVLPEVRSHVDAGFENRATHTQEVKVYASMRHLQASIYLSYVDGLSGWNEPGEAIKLLASKKTSRDGLRTLLAHEYGHVATFLLGPKATDMPWWILEGVAELSAEKFAAERSASRDAEPAKPGRDAAEIVDRWARRGRLAPWDKISDFRATPREFGGHVYKQGQHMVGFISEQFGRKARNSWLRAMSQGQTLNDACQTAMGISFEELDRRWRAALPPQDEPDPSPVPTEQPPSEK